MPTLQALKHRERLIKLINDSLDGLTVYELGKVLKFAAGTRYNVKRKGGALP